MKQSYMKTVLWIMCLCICSDLYAYDFEKDGIYYERFYSIGINGVAVTYKDTNYNSYSGEVMIPDSVEFDGTKYRVVNINMEAFQNCLELIKVTIPSSVFGMESNVFRGCPKLKNVNLPDNLKTIPKQAFYNCKALTDIKLPQELYNIEERAFYGCSSLSSISIPSTVNLICNEAFSYSGLKELTIDMRSWLSSAFKHCEKLEYVKIGPHVENIPLYAFENSTSLKEVEFDYGVKYISDYAFYGTKSLSKIIIPWSVTSIGKYAFCNSGIKSLTTPSKKIYEYAFAKCNSLEDVTLRNGVESIFRNGVEYIGNHAFNGCTALKSLMIPNCVSSISSRAFAECSSLTTVSIGDNVTYINESCFSGCTSLTTISLGKKVKEIGEQAFSRTDPTEIYIYNRNPPHPSSSSCGFDDTDYNNVNVYVPMGTKETYQKDYYWKKFKSITEFDATGIEAVSVVDKKESARYTLDGQRISEPKKGINIIKMDDGTTKKVLVK